MRALNKDLAGLKLFYSIFALQEISGDVADRGSQTELRTKVARTESPDEQCEAQARPKGPRKIGIFGVARD